MGDAERRAFLTEGTRTGKLAIVRRDGSPSVVPVWFVLDGDELIFTTGAETVKGRALRRDSRAAVCVDIEHSPYAYVQVAGRVEISTDPDELLEWATRIAARYTGAERAEEVGRENAGEGELLVRLRPERIVAIDFGDD
jgi:PPOX class probable F420-dependent enzyme